MKNKITTLILSAITLISTSSFAQIPYGAPATSSLLNSTFGAKAYSNTWTASNTFQSSFILDSVIDATSSGANAAVSTTKPTIILTAGGLTSIGSIASPVTGKLHVVTNNTGGSVTIVNEYASATAANRITTGTGANISVPDNGSLILSYNGNDSRWQVVGGSGGISSLTGDVTASGPGAAAATIANNVVTNAKLATVATATFKGRTTASTGNVEDLTATQATALLNVMVGDSGSGGTKGLVPAPASGDATKVLTGAGTYVAQTSGGVNLISNGKGEASASGWVCFADAAATSPADGTGGSPNITFTQTSSSPILDTGSFLYTKDAANRQGQGCAYQFTVEPGYQAKMLQLEFEYLVNSGTFVAGSNSSDSDVTVWLYDVTNSTLIQPTTYKLLASSTSISSRHVTNFQTSATGSTYRLIFYSGSTSSSAYALKVDDVQVKPSTYVYGTPITDWKSYTPTLTNASVGNGSTRFFWRRAGDTMEIKGNFILGTTSSVSGGTFKFSIPSGFSMDVSKSINSQVADSYSRVGYATVYDGGVKSMLQVIADVGSLNTFYLAGKDGTTVVDPMSNTSYSWGSADEIQIIDMKIPILGWSSSVQMSDSNGSRRVGASVYMSGDQSIPNNTITKLSLDTKLFDYTASFDTTNKRFVAPEQGLYHWDFHGAFNPNATGLRYHRIYKNGSAAPGAAGLALDVRATNGDFVTTQSTGDIELNAGDYIEVEVVQASGGALSIESDRTYFMIYKVGQPQTIGATETVNLQISSSSNNTINSTSPTIAYGTVIRDSHGAYSSGTWTTPVSGLYLFSGCFYEAAAAHTINHEVALIVYKNGSTTSKNIAQIRAATTSSMSLEACGSTQMNLLAGDAITIRGYADTASTLGSSASLNHVEITRIGN